jgi:hypothetical protein
MTTHNPMNDSTASGQLSWQEPEGLALLGIPISKEAQQIGLVFASEQRNVKKGKQVFLNTLSVIAVHECLQMFEFESYLESGDCWNKFKRLLSFNDADLLIQDFGRIECLPILPKQESIEIEKHLLETRVGCVGVKFHEHFNYVEMLGFKHFDKAFKSQQDNTRTFDVRDFQPFEDIFNYLKACPPSSIGKGNEWKPYEELGREKIIFAGGTSLDIKKRLPLRGKVIEIGENTKIILGATVEFLNNDTQSILFEIHNYIKERKLPKNLTITVLSNQGVVSTLSQLHIGDKPSFKTRFKNLTIRTIFTLIFSLNDVQIANRFIVEP